MWRQNGGVVAGVLIDMVWLARQAARDVRGWAIRTRPCDRRHTLCHRERLRDSANQAALVSAGRMEANEICQYRGYVPRKSLFLNY